MESFSSSFNNMYILVGTDYVSKWVETIISPTNDTKVALRFLKKNIFSRFSSPRVIVTNERKYFYNKQFDFLLLKYGFKYKTSLLYYLQTNGQAELANQKSNSSWRK
mgnify:CR=1 FL=1